MCLDLAMSSGEGGVLKFEFQFAMGNVRGSNSSSNSSKAAFVGGGRVRVPAGFVMTGCDFTRAGNMRSVTPTINGSPRASDARFGTCCYLHDHRLLQSSLVKCDEFGKPVASHF